MESIMSKGYNNRKHYTKKWLKRRLNLVNNSWMAEFLKDENSKEYKRLIGRYRKHSHLSCVSNCPMCMSPRHNKTISGDKQKYTLQELRSNINFNEWKEEAGI